MAELNIALKNNGALHKKQGISLKWPHCLTLLLVLGAQGTAWAELNNSNSLSGQLSHASDNGTALVDNTLAAPRTLFGSQKSSNSKFLNVDQAFKFTALQQQDKLLVSIKVAPNYYVYQQRFSIQPTQGLTAGKISFDQQAEFEDDPEFGNVPVFHRDVNLTIPLKGSGQFTLNWQGCAKAGLCYPPQQFHFNVEAVSAAPPQVLAPVSQPSVPATVQSNTAVKSSPVKVTALGENSPMVATALPEPLVLQTDINSQPLPEANATQTAELAKNSVISDPFGLAEHPFIAFGLLFLAGLGLAFTPCVLPMLPIVANLVATQHRRSAGHGLALSAAYAVGVASSYAVLGALIALFGHQVNLIALLQQPAVLISFALIFVVLALHSFELIQLRLPYFISRRIEKVGQLGQLSRWSGSIAGCWVAGFFSALIVSPCLSAPLAGVLLSVSSVGNPWLGAVALFSLGLGLGVPLMILGATEGKLLPKAGDWLNWVRRGFGLMLLAVALVLLNRVFTAAWMLLPWALLSLLFALWFWFWRGRGQLFSKALSFLLGIWAILQVVGAGLGATDPLRPLAPLTEWSKQASQQQVEVIYNLQQLADYQQKYPRLLVDVTADWCISCKIIERELFQKSPAPELQGWTRIKLDVTKTSAESKAVLESLNIFGPPALLLYQNGQLSEQVLGEPTAAEFRTVLQKHP